MTWREDILGTTGLTLTATPQQVFVQKSGVENAFMATMLRDVAMPPIVLRHSSFLATHCFFWPPVELTIRWWVTPHVAQHSTGSELPVAPFAPLLHILRQDMDAKELPL